MGFPVKDAKRGEMVLSNHLNARLRYIHFYIRFQDWSSPFREVSRQSVQE